MRGFFASQLEKDEGRRSSDTIVVVSRDSPLSKFMTWSVLSFIGSLAETDATTITGGIVSLPFHSLSSALLWRGSSGGLKIDTDGIQLTSKAARFRVTSQSASLFSGMERVRAAEDHDEITVESTTGSWVEKYLRSATADHTTAAFQLVDNVDSLRSLRNLPPRVMQSGTAAQVRQSDGILDIATALLRQSTS